MNNFSVQICKNAQIVVKNVGLGLGVRVGRPWMPIRIRRNDAGGSKSTTLLFW